ncbi:reverse transcriptase family protein [Nitrospira sp. M1]
MPSKKKAGGRYVCDQSPFYKLRSKARLASILEIAPSELKAHLKSADNDYSEFDITDPTKPNKKKRHIEEPKPKLRRIHKRIEKLLNRIFPPNYLFCPVKRRSYVTNAKEHVSAPEIAVLDIKKYYPSTRASRVFQFFHEEMHCDRDVAGILMTLCSFKGHLPTGSPLSPILSFLAHKRMWDRITEIVKKAGCQLTVYIDDLTISGPKVPGSLVWAVKQEIKNTGLQYHKEKSYKGKRVRKITGVIIKNNELRLPNVQHLKIHKLRMELVKEKDSGTKKKILERIRGSECHAKQIKVANG